MSDFETVLVPCRTDNYCVLLHDPASGHTAAIDAPESAPIIKTLDARKWRLSHIFTTHHHNDHTQGNADLKGRYGCRIIVPEAEADRIAGFDVTVSDNATFDFAGTPVTVMATPGHTLGHVSYVLPTRKLAFTGDTLFALGCGRVFEGNMEQMYASLMRIAALPDDTVVYCGHEYTLANGRFALSVEPENSALATRMRDIEAQRSVGLPTLPTTIGLEKETNPFLRASSQHIRARLGLLGASDVAVFAQLRTLKNKA